MAARSGSQVRPRGYAADSSTARCAWRSASHSRPAVARWASSSACSAASSISRSHCAAARQSADSRPAVARASSRACEDSSPFRSRPDRPKLIGQIAARPASSAVLIRRGYPVQTHLRYHRLIGRGVLPALLDPCTCRANRRLAGYNAPAAETLARRRHFCPPQEGQQDASRGRPPLADPPQIG